jgi:hypothetical protein
LGRRVQEVAEDLAGFGGFVAGQSASQAAVQARGDLGEGDIKVDLDADG